MGFLSVGMLWWLLGALVPVAIHLWRPRRPPEPIVAWGAMAFLRAERSRQPRVTWKHGWRRLRRWLLLASRVALIACLAVAAARPYAKPTPDGSARVPVSVAAPGSSGADRKRVLIFDVSASMGRRDAEGRSALERAKSWASDWLDRLGPDGSTILATASASGKLSILPGRDRIPNTPDQGSCDLSAALADAWALGSDGSAASRDREVVLLTDLQARAWRLDSTTTPRPSRMASGRVAVSVVDVGSGARAEPAVESLTLRPAILTAGQVGSAVVRLFNPDAEPRSATIELRDEGRAVGGPPRRVGPIPPGGRLSVRFTFRIDKIGVHRLTVRRIEASENKRDASAYAFDRAGAVAQVAPPPSILVIDGDPHPEPLRGETDFLRLALTQEADEPPLVRLRIVSGPDWGPADLQGQDGVIAADAPALLDHQARALREHVDAGGAVLVWLGDRASASALQTAMGGRLPADDSALRGDFEARGGEGGARLPLAEFLDDPSSSSSTPEDAPRLFAWHRLALRPDARVLARLDNGDPWIVQRSVGTKGGETIELAGPLDASGGTLPAHPDFVPLAHGLIRALTGRRLAVAEIEPGAPLRLDLGPSILDQPIAVPVFGPDGASGQAMLSAIDGRTWLRWDRPAQVGSHRFELPDGPRFAVAHPDAREMEPDRLSGEALRDLAERLSIRFETESGRVLAEPPLLGPGPGAKAKAGSGLARGDSAEEWGWMALALGLAMLSFEAVLRDFRATGLGKSSVNR